MYTVIIGFFYRGIYINPYRGADLEYIHRCIRYVEEGLINTFVIDVKDDKGYIRFEYDDDIARKVKAIRPVLNVDSLVALKKKYGFKLIGRIVVFKDSRLCNYKNYGVRSRRGGIWKDAGGAMWCDPYNRDVWDYNVRVAEAIVKMGFDEVQFDYVRFPTDGDIYNCIFPSQDGRERWEVITGFLKYAKSRIKAKVSADIFGYATWRELRTEGQEVGKMSNYIDYVCPMLYPSHFSSGDGYWLPKFIREFWIYYISVERARRRIEENNPSCYIVTYVQGFDYKAPHFSPDYIYYQIKGSILAGSHGFFIWNAKGDYGVAMEALRRWDFERGGVYDRVRYPEYYLTSSYIDSEEYFKIKLTLIQKLLLWMRILNLSNLLF